MNIKYRIFKIIQIGNKEDLPSRAFDILLAFVIILNITVMFLQTFEEFSRFNTLFTVVEVVTVSLFCIEYALRIWTAEYLYPAESRPRAILHFLRSFDGVVDLLTILPFFFLSGFVVFRMLRVVRIFHLFRINSRYDSFNVIKSVIYEKRNQLLSSVFIIVVLMLASSLFLYHAEHNAQPDAFKNAFSGIWWSMSTLSTVGYGDLYPITPIGQFMAIVITFLGIGVVAIPTGIISAGFVEQYNKMKDTGIESDISTILIEIDSAWLGKTVQEVEETFHVDIVMVRQGDQVMHPRPDYVLHLSDAVAIYKK